MSSSAIPQDVRRGLPARQQHTAQGHSAVAVGNRLRGHQVRPTLDRLVGPDHSWVARPRASGDGRGEPPCHALRKLRDVPPLRRTVFEGKTGKCNCSKQLCHFAYAARIIRASPADEDSHRFCWPPQYVGSCGQRSGFTSAAIRLYEQGADAIRIGKYVSKWPIWFSSGIAGAFDASERANHAWREHGEREDAGVAILTRGVVAHLARPDESARCPVVQAVFRSVPRNLNALLLRALRRVVDVKSPTNGFSARRCRTNPACISHPFRAKTSRYGASTYSGQ